MLTTITALTDAQRAVIPAHVEKWIKIGLSTEPADRELAEDSLRAIGLERVVLSTLSTLLDWMRSPY